MKKSHALLLIIGALIVGIVAGGWAVSRFHVRYAGYSTASDANMTHASLKALRGANTTGAVELLEIKLDGALVSLAPFLTERSKLRRDPVYLKVFRSVKAYRKEFPRASQDGDDVVDRAFSLLDENQ